MSRGKMALIGVAVLVCTVIAIAMLPLMKRLSETHRSRDPTGDVPLPTIASGE